MTVQLVGPSSLWYLTRGTGVVALVLVTATVVLGILATGGWQSQRQPRFLTQGLHRNLALLVVVFGVLHIVTTELDPFAPVGWAAAVVPFDSPYRTIWLGLGTLATDILVAIVVTSLIRVHLGYRTWRTVHWLAYAAWPLTLLHSLGTGSDARVGLFQVVALVSLAAVAIAGALRLASEWRRRRGLVLGMGGAAAAVFLAGAAWAGSGPLQPGWAARAGTPAPVLPSGGGTTATTPSAGLPAPPFRAVVTGRSLMSAPSAQGLVALRLDLVLSHGATGVVTILMDGRLGSGGTLSVVTSQASAGPATQPTLYQGHLVSTPKQGLLVRLVSSTGAQLDLLVQVQIDQGSAAVHGTAEGLVPSPAAATSSPGPG
ncbi:MAG TPA: ferric reductase-like transmembrane domain-containing protein [Candidatus Dormibacteraeota bacterium]|nr:ferric reductase-like transmembrane domain-containing protein [Candidatus Dormibacteraeota bacterium]